MMLDYTPRALPLGALVLIQPTETCFFVKIIGLNKLITVVIKVHHHPDQVPDQGLAC